MPESDVSEVLISPPEIRRLLERGEPVTAVDARGRTAFLRGPERVDGDMRAEGRDLAWSEGLRPETWLLAYCTCLGDGLAIRVAARLREAGFPRAFAVERGLEGCREAGLPVVPK